MSAFRGLLDDGRPARGAGVLGGVLDDATASLRPLVDQLGAGLRANFEDAARQSAIAGSVTGGLLTAAAIGLVAWRIARRHAR